MSSALAAMSRHRLATSKSPSPSPSQTRSAAKETASPRWRAKPRRWAAVTSVAGMAAEGRRQGEASCAPILHESANTDFSSENNVV
eukprot:scaffold8158_cov91-Isochrysis_galbana.AAC.1